MSLKLILVRFAHAWRFYFVVIGFVLSLGPLADAENTANSAPAAAVSTELPAARIGAVEKCLRSLFEKMDGLNSYSTRMEKTETTNGNTETQIIRLQHDMKTHHIVLTYLNQGHSGIKNNGMVVTYDGTPEINVKLGKATGISTLFHPLVSAVAGKSMELTDSKALEGEIFTANRAGFAFLAEILKLHDGENDFDWNAFKIEKPGTCQILYRPAALKYEDVTLKPSDDIFQFEDRFGQPAYLIYLDNKEKIGSFQKLFDRSKDLPVRVSKQFTAFDLKLDPVTALPDSFTLYHNEKKIGTYQFSETELK